jgi:hypothetical protein
MNLHTSAASAAFDPADTFTEEELLAAIDGPDLISDDDIDYAEIARRTQPGQPGGEIVFDSADYATDEEAMAALEALFLHDLMAPLHESSSAD